MTNPVFSIILTVVKVLVTGVAGFIGSHLAERLLDEGNEVIGIDNFLTGKRENIEHLLSRPSFTFIEHDVNDPYDYPDGISEIYHLASAASPVFYTKYAIETLLTGSLGTYQMLELARKTRARFLFTSTSEIYGDPEEHPQREEYWGNVNPIGERSMYDESKRFGEALVMAFHRKYGMDTKIARIFNTYGPRMRDDDGRVIPNFIMQALRDEPLTVYGDGTQTRSFCYISDMVDGIIKLMRSDYHLPVNLGNPEEYRIIDVAKIILKVTGREEKIEYRPLPPDDPKKRRPDISRAKEVLGWEPKVPFEKGLKETIEWFRERMSQ